MFFSSYSNKVIQYYIALEKRKERVVSYDLMYNEEIKEDSGGKIKVSLVNINTKIIKYIL